MPETLLFIVIIVIALLGVVVMSWGETIGPRPARPDPLEEAAAAQRAAITAADTARASARSANTAELAEFDADARRILDALDVPCVCSQVLTHEWDGRTQSYRQRWTVPVHFTACAKHWPATTGAPPPPGTIAHLQRQGGPMLTPAARVAAERARYAAAMLREYSTTTYGVPADCTCVPYHARAALASTHVVHRVGCATNRGTHAAEWRPVRDNG